MKTILTLVHFLLDRMGLRGTLEIQRLGQAVLRALRLELSRTHRTPLKGDISVADSLAARLPALRWTWLRKIYYTINLFYLSILFFWKQGNLWTSHGGAGQVQTSHASPRIPRPAQGTLFRRQLRRRQCPGIITPSLYSWKLFKTFRFNLVGARE